MFQFLRQLQPAVGSSCCSFGEWCQWPSVSFASQLPPTTTTKRRAPPTRKATSKWPTSTPPTSSFSTWAQCKFDYRSGKYLSATHQVGGSGTGWWIFLWKWGQLDWLPALLLTYLSRRLPLTFLFTASQAFALHLHGEQFRANCVIKFRKRSVQLAESETKTINSLNLFNWNRQTVQFSNALHFYFPCNKTRLLFSSSWLIKTCSLFSDVVVVFVVFVVFVVVVVCCIGVCIVVPNSPVWTCFFFTTRLFNKLHQGLSSQLMAWWKVRGGGWMKWAVQGYRIPERGVAVGKLRATDFGLIRLVHCWCENSANMYTTLEEVYCSMCVCVRGRAPMYVCVWECMCEWTGVYV